MALRRSAVLRADVPSPARAAAQLGRTVRQQLNGDGTLAQLTRFAAQLRGGGLAVGGLLATSYALLTLQAAVPDVSLLIQVLMIGAVTGGIGLVRFVALRAWVFTTTSRALSARP